MKPRRHLKMQPNHSPTLDELEKCRQKLFDDLQEGRRLFSVTDSRELLLNNIGIAHIQDKIDALRADAYRRKEAS